jgi:pimeloyl-ACP methyl ester carboxylesterase
MKGIANGNSVDTAIDSKLVKTHSLCLAFCLVFLYLIFGVLEVQAGWPRIVPSKDGTPISFESDGTGGPTLVFVHGWCCDARYWRAQIPYFSRNQRVVTIDLAGHGHSGMTRGQYSMTAFGEDVHAVIEAIGTHRAILVGHSMGGSVIAEAARIMPERIIGLIGIDTLQNIEYPLTREELTNMLTPLQKDFHIGSRRFVEEMISPHMEPKLREWILSDISAAPPNVALNALNCFMSQYISGDAAKIFDKIPIPVVAVNSDMWPVNYEANRRHMSSFDAVFLEGTDHFLMLDRSEEFNHALEKAIQKISGNGNH